MSDQSIIKALADVMRDIKYVGKDGKNDFDNYNFRGIDGVMNAVGPVFRKHGVVAIPEVVDYKRATVESSNGRAMTSVALQMRVHFYGPAGDSIDATVWGEAFDRGDKATAKAHSVAFRTALLQTLCLPTQDPDPDEFSYQISKTSSEVSPEFRKMAEACTSIDDLRELYKRTTHDGERLFLAEVAQRLQEKP